MICMWVREMFEIKEEREKRPFRCVLNPGVAQSATGMTTVKGVIVGSTCIPHSEKRLLRCSKDEGFYPEELSERNLGLHVQE